VLPVGGIKEKVLAAHRAGLRTVILPKRNEVDLEDLPENVRKEMTFIFAEQVDQVWAAALCDSTGDGSQPQPITQPAQPEPQGEVEPA
jgi:ATP-dependent Lon protease